MSTFPDLLARRLARDPGQPFVTFYDDATGERTELSVTTYANWVAKTANLLVDELMLYAGDRAALRLPVHWLGPVFLGAAWSVGLELVDVPGAAGETAPDEVSGVDLVVTGPDASPRGRTTLACALGPFAQRFPGGAPEGVLDYGELWPGQPDAFVPHEAAELPEVSPLDNRVLTDHNPVVATGRQLVVRALAGSGSLVLLGNAAEGSGPARSESERATMTLRSTEEPPGGGGPQPID